MKNIIKFIGIVAYIFAVIGGFGYCAYIHKWLFAISIVILGVMAFPAFRKCWPSKEA